MPGSSVGGLVVGAGVEFVVGAGVGVGAGVEFVAGGGVGIVDVGAGVEFVGAGQPPIHKGSMCGSLQRSLQSDGSRLSDPVQSLCTRRSTCGYFAVPSGYSPTRSTASAPCSAALATQYAMGSQAQQRRTAHCGSCACARC